MVSPAGILSATASAVARLSVRAVSSDSGRFESPLVSPAGLVHLTLRALDGQKFVIQASTNLASWTDLGTVTVVGESAEFVDVDATNCPSRYYRAKRF